MLTKVKALISKHRSFICFVFVGTISTSLDFFVFALALKPGINVIAAQAAAYISGLVCSFFLNKYISFKNNAKSLRQVFLFLLVYGVSLLASMGAIYLFSVIIGIQEHVAKIFFVTPIVVAINYSGLRYIVFPKKQLNK